MDNFSTKREKLATDVEDVSEKSDASGLVDFSRRNDVISVKSLPSEVPASLHSDTAVALVAVRRSVQTAKRRFAIHSLHFCSVVRCRKLSFLEVN